MPNVECRSVYPADPPLGPLRLFFRHPALPRQLKLKRVRNADVDVGVLQFYACFAVALSGFLVLAVEPFIFSKWGILGAVIWILSQMAAMNGFTMISIAVAAPLVAGVTIIVSFLWGITYFGEEVTSMAGSLLGIAVIVLGIVGVAVSSTSMPQTWWNAIQRARGRAAPTAEHELLESAADDAGNASGTDEETGLDESSLSASGTVKLDSRSPSAVELLPTAAELAAAAAKRQTMLGFAVCIVCGLLNGMVMVPSSLFGLDVAATVAAGEYPERRPTGLAYLPSLGIGIFVVMLPLHALYFAARRRWPQLKPREVALPGLATGVLWAVGNACAVVATEALGNTVGYPLTQTALLVAQVWSVLYFKEIRGFAIVVLVMSAFVLLGGAAMLAVYG